MKLKNIVATVGIVIGCMSVSNAFSDMPKEHWAYNKVQEMTSKGIISGYTDGTFKPEREVTREEFATILTKTLELKPVGEIVNFRDVDGSRWSKSYIDASSRYLTGYLNNGNYYFSPDSYAVREDMAVAVVKAKGLDNETPNYSVLDRFSDKDKISENLKKYIAIAVENGIMSGNANGTFNPLGNLTRAEITALMCNVLEKVVIEDEIEDTHVHKLSTKYIYKSETSHTEEKYCKTCGEVTESKTKVHSYEDDECKCGHEREHKHEIRIKYIYKNGTGHIEQEYCRKCEEVIDQSTKTHEFVDGECDCGAVKEHKHENAIKYIYKDKTNHVVKTYCKDCDEIIGENANAHEYKDGVCICGAKEAHKHELAIKYVNKDEKKHIVETYCKTCNEVISEETKAHEYKDSKCVCGAEEEEIIYGDVTGDGKINSGDSSALRGHMSGSNILSGKNLKSGDVDLDGNITQNDLWLVRRYVSKSISSLPHGCSNHTENYEKINQEKHNKIEECECGEISYENAEPHEFIDGKCECGAEEIKEITIRGIVGSYNPNNEVNIKLQKDGKTITSTTIDSTSGNGYKEQEFELIVDEVGTFDLVVTKIGHTTYTIKDIVLDTELVDLTDNSNSNISLIRLIAGDVNEDEIVNEGDVEFIRSTINKSTESVEEEYKIADVNGDGSITEGDVMVVRYKTHINKGDITVDWN